MKYAKMLGLAVVSALAVMAFIGAGSASATKICITVPEKEADGKCTTAKAERELKQNETVTGTSTNATLTSSITNVICNNSSTTVKMTSANTVTPVTGEVTALSFTNCKTSGGTACTVTVRNLPYSGSLTSTAQTVTDPVGAGAQVTCGFLINCEFLTKEVVLGVTHEGGNSQFVASKEKLTATGGFCPETSEWDATYTASGVTIE